MRRGEHHVVRAAQRAVVRRRQPQGVRAGAFAVNDGVKVVALVSVDPAGPATTAQEYVRGSPSGSEAVPERT